MLVVSITLLTVCVCVSCTHSRTTRQYITDFKTKLPIYVHVTYILNTRKHLQDDLNEEHYIQLPLKQLFDRKYVIKCDNLLIQLFRVKKLFYI